MPDTEALSKKFSTFIGPLPRKRKADSLRPAVRNALRAYPMLLPDFTTDGRQDFLAARPRIDRAVACFFEVSDPDCSKTFTQLGYALGRGIPCFLLRRREAPSLGGFEDCRTILYADVKDLEEQLREIKLLPRILNCASKSAQTSAQETENFLDPMLLAAVGESLARQTLDPGRIFRIAGSGGFSEEQVMHTLRAFASIGLAEEIGVDWHLTEAGKSSLARPQGKGGSTQVH